MEAYIDDLIAEIGAEYNCVLGYDVKTENTEEEYETGLINYNDRYYSPETKTYTLTTAYVYIKDITTEKGCLTFKEPILMLELCFDEREGFSRRDCTINWSSFTPEKAAQEFTKQITK